MPRLASTSTTATYIQVPHSGRGHKGLMCGHDSALDANTLYQHMLHQGPLMIRVLYQRVLTSIKSRSKDKEWRGSKPRM
jgi:hypothetical protein